MLLNSHYSIYSIMLLLSSHANDCRVTRMLRLLGSDVHVQYIGYTLHRSAQLIKLDGHKINNEGTGVGTLRCSRHTNDFPALPVYIAHNELIYSLLLNIVHKYSRDRH
jgi:hypothetical protein